MTELLVIEDDPHMRRLLEMTLSSEGYSVSTVADGESGLSRALQDRPNLIILDVMLPERSGWEVCREIRASSDVPIIMLTALGEEEHEVQGLDAGADDYIAKPFSPPQLLARIRACLRRAGVDESEQLRFGPLLLETDRRRVRVDGRTLDLTPKEYELLHHLASHPYRVFSREQLLDAVWGYDYTGDTRTVNEHVRRLRKKLDPDETERFIETVWGVGYRFDPGEDDG